MAFTPASNLVLESIQFNSNYATKPEIRQARVTVSWTNPVATPLDRGWDVWLKVTNEADETISFGHVNGWANPLTSFHYDFGVPEFNPDGGAFICPEAGGTPLTYTIALHSRYLGFVNGQPSYSQSEPPTSAIEVVLEPPAKPTTDTSPSGLDFSDEGTDEGCIRTIHFTWDEGEDGSYYYVQGDQDWVFFPAAEGDVLEVSNSPLFPEEDDPETPEFESTAAIAVADGEYDLFTDPFTTYYARLAGDPDNVVTIPALSPEDVGITYTVLLYNFSPTDSVLLLAIAAGPGSPIPEGVTADGCDWSLVASVDSPIGRLSVYASRAPDTFYDVGTPLECHVALRWYDANFLYGVSYVVGNLIIDEGDEVTILQTVVASGEGAFPGLTLAPFQSNQNRGVAFFLFPILPFSATNATNAMVKQQTWDIFAGAAGVGTPESPVAVDRPCAYWSVGGRIDVTGPTSYSGILAPEILQPGLEVEYDGEETHWCAIALEVAR